jgi:6-phosphogluconolactonase (cycloisomerase 2 family)
VVANEDSDTLKFFAIDPDTGLLDYTGVTVPTESPTCVIFCSR